MCTILSTGTVSTDKPPHDSVSDDAFFSLYTRFEIYHFKFIIVISLSRFFTIISKLFNHFILTHKYS